MKNFPHQFNDLSKLFGSLQVIQQLIEEEIPLSDESFGELLTRNGIYTYRNKTLSIDEYLWSEGQKPRSNRGYLTVARDIRRLFQLLGFLTVFPDKSGELSSAAIQLLAQDSEELKSQLWKNSFFQLCIEGHDGEISHPYRILLKLVQDFPGIETSKLMLALEAENDSEEEYARISALAEEPIESIINNIGTTSSMAKNAVKILPGIAEQLGDILRDDNRAYIIGRVSVTEDEITTEREFNAPYPQIPNYREVNANTIARDPNLAAITSSSIDLAEAIRKRQNRLAKHQEIVRLLAILNANSGLNLYEGKFDCLAKTNTQEALLYEIKTILDLSSDQEKQTVKGLGQVKYYKFSIVIREMNLNNVTSFLVFSQRPNQSLIDFCVYENVNVVWLDNQQVFNIYDDDKKGDQVFNPSDFLSQNL